MDGQKQKETPPFHALQVDDDYRLTPLPHSRPALNSCDYINSKQECLVNAVFVISNIQALEIKQNALIAKIGWSVVKRREEGVKIVWLLNW